MIKKWLITGDTHGANTQVIRRARKMYPNFLPNEIGLIILGDAGFNCGRPEEDAKWKKIVNKFGVQVYCVRGNHDQHPKYMNENEYCFDKFFDENVQGLIYQQKKYPNIKYFLDGHEYIIDGLHTLVIGGAYSIDKNYRLENNMFWEPHEQLTKQEMKDISETFKGEHFNLILSHTCPLSWQPKDLFLTFIDQKEVDNSMEVWMEEFKDLITFDMWYFGHYHQDRLVRPCGVQMLYKNIDSLDKAKARWIDKDPEYLIGWAKDPNYYL